MTVRFRPEAVVAGTPDVILTTGCSFTVDSELRISSFNLVIDFPCRMRLAQFVLLLATMLLGPIFSAADEVKDGIVGEILPDPVARTGEFNASFTLTELLGATSAQPYESIMPTDEAIEWAIFVPENYNIGRPAGVLVYISPTQSGSIPKQWKSLMDEHNLIWIGANGSGNRVLVPRRMVYAVIAPAVIEKNYKIDLERVYLTGFSGGGKTASIVSSQYPQIYKGAIFNCGAKFWGSETPERLGQIKSNRYVFVTGTYDQALEPTKKVFKAFQDAGVANSTLMVIRKMAHRNPNNRNFGKAIAYLDSRQSNP